MSRTTWTVVTERRLADRGDEYITRFLSFREAEFMFGEDLGPVDVIVSVTNETLS